MTEEQRPTLFHPASGARISLPYGVEGDYWKDYGIKDHRGVDFALPEGSHFRAAFTGTIWTAAQRNVRRSGRCAAGARNGGGATAGDRAARATDGTVTQEE